MKISAPNRASQPTTKTVVPGKASKIAYSAIFALSLLSTAPKLITDTFTKSNAKPETELAENNNNYTTTNNSSAQKAQIVYTDGWGNSWVRYSDYKQLEQQKEAEKREFNETLEDYLYSRFELKSKLHDYTEMTKKKDRQNMTIGNIVLLLTTAATFYLVDNKIKKKKQQSVTQNKVEGQSK